MYLVILKPRITSPKCRYQYGVQRCVHQSSSASLYEDYKENRNVTAVWFSSSTLHSRVLGEHSQLKEELEAVRGHNTQLIREHNHVKQACEELRRLHEDDQREVTDMRILHQQVPVHSINIHSFYSTLKFYCPDFQRLFILDPRCSKQL